MRVARPAAVVRAVAQVLHLPPARYCSFSGRAPGAVVFTLNRTVAFFLDAPEVDQPENPVRARRVTEFCVAPAAELVPM